MSNYKNISELLGKTLTEINVNRVADEITFTCATGEQYRMLHIQDCCEGVVIDDIVGDIQDLIGSPITMAEEATDTESPKTEVYNKGEKNEWTSTDESSTWTFYKLATIKGYVNIKWYGTSNGYYSESADFVLL